MTLKCFKNGLFGKDRLKKKQFQLSYFKLYFKCVQNALKIFYKSLKDLVKKGWKLFDLIWSPKRLISKRIWKCGLNLLFDIKKGIENLLFSFLKKLWNWFGLILEVPKEFIQNDLKIKFKCFICFLKYWKSLV